MQCLNSFPVSYQCSIWQLLGDGCTIGIPIIEHALHGMLSLTEGECSATMHNATTSAKEAWAKMKEATDQIDEQFQTLQRKNLFNKSSLRCEISSGFFGVEKLFDTTGDCNIGGISGFNDGHRPYLQLRLAAYCLLFPPPSNPLSNTQRSPQPRWAICSTNSRECLRHWVVCRTLPKHVLPQTFWLFWHVIGRDGLAEMGQYTAEPTHGTTWRLVLTSSLCTHSLVVGSKGWLHIQKEKAQKISFT